MSIIPFKKVAVLMGGQSAERSISLKSGNAVLSALLSQGVNAVGIDVDENIVRAIGLKNGLVDVKIAAVNNIWSGLKFVYRTRDRK